MTLGFVTQSPEHGNGYPGTNFAAHCASGVYYNNGQETQLLKDCDFIKADIKTCQSLGKKILLSIGGVWSEVNDYSLSSTTAGGDFADFLFDAFGPYQEGYDGPRPFDPTGDHTSIDGFDFDIEVKFRKLPLFLGIPGCLKSYIGHFCCCCLTLINSRPTAIRRHG